MPPIGRSAVVEMYLDAAAARAHVARRALHLVRVPRRPARRGSFRDPLGLAPEAIGRSLPEAIVPSLANLRTRRSKQAPLSCTIGRFNGIRRTRARSNCLIASGYHLAADQPAGRDGPRDCRRFE